MFYAYISVEVVGCGVPGAAMKILPGFIMEAEAGTAEDA